MQQKAEMCIRDRGNVGGRADDYTFEAGYTYNFTVYLLGQNDATAVEIIPGGGTPNTLSLIHILSLNMSVML